MGNLLSGRDTHSCPFLFKCDIMLMEESQGHGGFLLWCQVHSKEQGRKSLSQVTMTNLSSLLIKILPFELGGWLFLVALYSAHGTEFTVHMCLRPSPNGVCVALKPVSF